MFALIREAIHDLISELRTALSGREQAGERDVNDQEGRIADVSRTPFFIFGLLGGGMTIVAVAAHISTRQRLSRLRFIRTDGSLIEKASLSTSLFRYCFSWRCCG
jgi:hypothetical protein